MNPKSHRIRLVYDRAKYVRDTVSPLSLQYHLPLSIPDNVIVTDVSKYRFSDFEKAIAFSTPTWVFDFRRNARFDLLAGGRSSAFRTFDKYSTKYVDVQGMVPRGTPFLELKRRSLWKKTFRLVFMNKKSCGPYLIICDDLNMFIELSESIMAGLMYTSKARLKLSLLTVNLARRGEEVWREVM